MKRFLFLLLLTSSCAFFKSQPSLKDTEVQTLINSLKLVGEGKGRLSLGQNQYVFGFDAVLKENTDWILAVAIPLQGEEVMILSELKYKIPTHTAQDSFEERIEDELRNRTKDKTLSTKIFMKELRSLIRFVMSDHLKLNRQCKQEGHLSNCTLDRENFLVLVGDKEIRIRKNFDSKHTVELVGQNFTNKSFGRSDFFLRKNSIEGAPQGHLLSLELFWRD